MTLLKHCNFKKHLGKIILIITFNEQVLHSNMIINHTYKLFIKKNFIKLPDSKNSECVVSVLHTAQTYLIF